MPHVLLSCKDVESTLRKRRVLCFVQAVMSKNTNSASTYAAKTTGQWESPVPYKPPEFASRIAHLAPSSRLNLVQRPTPIHQWFIPGLREDISVHIKRDDMTGANTSGNKIRKLEFLLADAIEKRCDTIITAGGVQSNHARATAVAAKELGLHAHVFLRTRAWEHPEQLGADGNVLFHKLLGVGISLIPRLPYQTGILPKMQLLAAQMRKEGRAPYLIGIGGSDNIGLWGYLDAFSEMVEQGVHEKFTDIVVPIGSGGTASGLAIANYLSGSKLRVHAVTVCDTPQYFYDHLNEMLKTLGLASDTNAENILNIIVGKGRGYAVSTDEELELGVKISRETGILLDPVYTLKAVFSLLRELNKPNSSFERGTRILFVHTGGIFGLFDRRVEPYLDNSLAKTWIDP